MEVAGTNDGVREGDHETLKPRISSILYVTLIASTGGLVFGYYVGFIMARFVVLSDLDSVLQETIRTGLVGAILGAAAGGWTNDCLGRKRSILIADAFIFIGAVLHMLLLSVGEMYCLETVGNMCIAFGVGMVSMTSPLYISELSPPKLRDILISINFVFYGVGKLTFLYLQDDSSRNTNYIVAFAGIPALFQFRLMKPLSESPMWLYKKGREADAIKVLKKMYTCCKVKKGFDAFMLLIKNEIDDDDELSYSPGASIFSKIRTAWGNPLVRQQFVVGSCLQAAQQLVGINALIYCIPFFLRMTSFGPSDPKDEIPFRKTSILSSMGLFSIYGGLCCTFCLMERFGKRKLLSWSTYCVLAVLLGLSVIFIISPNTTDDMSPLESTMHFKNKTCSSYVTEPVEDLTCPQVSSGCGNCRGMHNDSLGQFSDACLIAESSGTSQASQRSVVFVLPVTFIFCILVLSVSIEVIPWILNAQMYPTEVRGVYGGTAAAFNWTYFLIVIVVYFVLTETQGPIFTFLFISLLSFFLSVFIKSFVPENLGLLISARKRK